MEPILLVTLKSRPCARLPPWRPGAPAPRCAPRQSRLPSPGNLAISQSPDSSSVPGCLSGWGAPASPARGAPSEDPARPKAPRPRRPNKAGGGVRAALPGLSPCWPAALGCLGLNNLRDAAGRAPARAEGPGPGRWLPRAPAAACALAGVAQVSVGAHPGTPEDRLGVESGVAETPAISLSFGSAKRLDPIHGR